MEQPKITFLARFTLRKTSVDGNPIKIYVYITKEGVILVNTLVLTNDLVVSGFKYKYSKFNKHLHNRKFAIRFETLSEIFHSCAHFYNVNKINMKEFY